MAGFSIPAAEHSTITSWGKAHEIAAYDNMLEQFAKPGKIVAVVSDSYDLWNAIANIWGNALKEKIIASGATVVIRPDSGDPVKVVKRCAEMLDESFGHTVNLEGYRVLNNVRIIQGDGINEDSIKAILAHVTGAGYSAENISFGMGGALLQHMNRDTLKFAMKASNVVIDGEDREVFKQPATDFAKSSKKGRQMLFECVNTPTYITRPQNTRVNGCIDGLAYLEALETVYKNGTMYRTQSLADIRKLTNE
jgi:nicotinamide phosphoribosyltransferase